MLRKHSMMSGNVMCTAGLFTFSLKFPPNMFCYEEHVFCPVLTLWLDIRASQHKVCLFFFLSIPFPFDITSSV